MRVDRFRFKCYDASFASFPGLRNTVLVFVAETTSSQITKGSTQKMYKY